MAFALLFSFLLAFITSSTFYFKAPTDKYPASAPFLTKKLCKQFLKAHLKAQFLAQAEP